jgi:hypothetical protein
MTPDESAARDAAARFMRQLEANEWSFSLTAAGDLRLIVGNNPPPWTQPQIFAALDARASEIIRLVAERDGLAHIDGGRAIH